MSKRLLLALPLTLSLSLLAGCSGDDGGADGGAVGEPDAGVTGGDDGGQDGGTSDAGTGPELGASCAFGSAECGEGRLCSSLYGDGMGGVDQTTATCFAACSQQGASCTGSLGQEGTCTGVSQPGGGQLACVVTAGDFEVCANSHNSVCATGVNCLRFDGAALGVCATVCDPEGDPCPGTQLCSTSPIQVGGPDGSTLGVCSEPSTVGDACNPDPADGDVRVCTGDQQCVQMGDFGPTTCQVQ